MFPKLILASQSPRRKQLLQWAELDFETVPAHTDESFPVSLSFPEIAIHIALQKAKEIASRGYHHPVVAADTIVVCNNELLGKPVDDDDAFQMLRKLSGNEHRVITGVAVIYDGKEHVFADETKVWFNTLTDDEIRNYVQQHRPFDKAGAYAIQEWIGVVGIRKIEGDFYNVMGLPVNRLYQLLREIFSATPQR